MVSYYDSVAYRRAAAEREAERQDRQRQAEEEREQARRENEDARARYMAGLEAQKVTREQLAAQRLEDELSADRIRLERAWLVDHPEKSAADFRRVAWPLLKANLLDERRAAAVDELTNRMRADPMFRQL